MSPNTQFDRFPKTLHKIRAGIEAGWQSGFQIYVSRDFDVRLDQGVGENSRDVPLTSATRMLWLSAGKPLTAVAILQHIESGKIGLDQPVVDLLPELSGTGTEKLTIANFLNHTAGLKPVVLGFPDVTWEQMLSKVLSAGLKRDQSPGSNVGYDPGRTWVLLGEILQRLDDQQRSVAQILREDLLEPIGMLNSWLAYPEEELSSKPDLVGVSYLAANGKLSPTRTSDPENIGKANPGSSMRGPIRELGLFYEMLLRGGITSNGRKILNPETIRLMTSRHRENQLDHSFQQIVDFGLGVIINSARYGKVPVPYGFGASASDESYGHGGSQSVIGMVDPQRRLVITAIANGLPGDEIHNARFHELLTAVYEDLEIAPVS